MGTRGAYGLRKDGVDKVTYNHSDSYPTWLGIVVINFIQATTVEDMNELFDRIELVQNDSTPTPEQIAACKVVTNLSVSEKSLTDWYCLLREAQGDLNGHFDIPFMIDSSEFLNDSLSCEWAYIINLDTNFLEVYKGFNKDKNAEGRYAKNTDRESPEYYGVRLVDVIPFEKFMDMDSDGVVQLMGDIKKKFNEE